MTNYEFPRKKDKEMDKSTSECQLEIVLQMRLLQLSESSVQPQIPVVHSSSAGGW